MPTLNVKSLVSGVRDYLRNPSHDTLNNGTVLLRLSDKLDHYSTLLNLTDQNWLLARFDLAIDTATDEYPISRPDFGRVVLVETTDDSDLLYERMEVDVVDMQNLNRYIGTGQRAMAIVRENGGARFRFSERPTVDTTLRVFYEPLRTATLSIEDDAAFIGNFGNLLKVDTALACLPNCDYEEPKYGRLEAALLRDYATFYRAFETYRFADRQEDSGPRRMWPDGGA